MIKSRCSNLQHDFLTVRNDLSGQIDQAPADRVGVATSGNHGSTDVFFESLKQKITQQHQIIPGGIGDEPFKRQLLVAKVIQCPVGQFITAAVMITGDNGISAQILGSPGHFEPMIALLSMADVGDNDSVRPTAGKVKLLAVIEHTAVQRPSKGLPVTTPEAKFNILPSLFIARRKSAPQPVFGVCGQGLDVFVNFTAADIANLQLFAELKDLMIKKTAVHPEDNRHIRAIFFANQGHDMPDHLFDRSAMVGVLIAATEDGIDNQSAQVHLQRLETFDSSVCRFDPVSALRIVVVQHHGVDAKLNQIRLHKVKSPNKQMLQQTPEQIDPRPGKRIKKALDPVGGGHLAHSRFYTSCIAAVLGQMVEIAHMPAGAVCHKTQHLFEYFKDRHPFFTLSDGTKISVDQRKYVDSVQVAYKQRQPGSSGQPFAGSFNRPDLQFLFSIFFAISLHRVLHLLGMLCLVILLVAFKNHTSNLPSGEGLFYFKNRLH